MVASHDRKIDRVVGGDSVSVTDDASERISRDPARDSSSILVVVPLGRFQFPRQFPVVLVQRHCVMVGVSLLEYITSQLND